MQELTIKADTTGTTTITGNWELRAGGHDTIGWQRGAANAVYPGGGTDTFSASNTDSGATNLYSPGPKMALLAMTTASDVTVVVLEGGNLSGFHSAFVTQVSGTASTSVPTIAATLIAGDADEDDIKEITLTLTTVGTGTGLFNVMMLYS